MKLYELTSNYNNLLELLDNPEIEQQVITDALNNVEEDITDKLENIAKIIKDLDSDVKSLKEEEKRLAERRKAKEKQISNLKAYAEGSMSLCGLNKVEGKVFTISLQNNPPKVDIWNEKDLPVEYYKTVTTENVAKIKEDLKAGKEVPGAILTVEKSLRIR